MLFLSVVKFHIAQNTIKSDILQTEKILRNFLRGINWKKKKKKKKKMCKIDPTQEQTTEIIICVISHRKKPTSRSKAFWMDLKSKVSENATVKLCTLRMRLWMEYVPSTKMNLKFKLDSLFPKWFCGEHFHYFCAAIFFFWSQEIPFYM